MKQFTIDELKKYDGKDGRPAYVAYDGKIYDVTQSGAWDAGGHFGQHFAGKDLTMELKDAPHGDQVFEHIPTVGELKPTEGLRMETKGPASTQPQHLNPQSNLHSCSRISIFSTKKEKSSFLLTI